MIDFIPFLPASLLDRETINAVLQAALQAADPEQSVLRSLRRDGDRLLVGGQSYDLQACRRCFLIGAGKGSFAMGRGVAGLLADVPLQGAVVVKHLPVDASALVDRGIKVLQGEHPRPGRKSLESTREIMAFARQAGREDLVIFVLSGGASALLTAPREGLSLEDMQNLTGLLLKCGAAIGEINTLRKHLDEVKGGGLAAMTAPAEMISLVLSDVIGNPLDVIGSGPATGDRGSFEDAWSILEKYSLMEQTPPGVVRILKSGLEGRLRETIRPEDGIFEKVNQVVVGSNEQSVDAARLKARDLGLEAEVITTTLQGEAREQGARLAHLLRDALRRNLKSFCLIAGGETTVTVRGKGVGGRNLELVLGAVEAMQGLRDACLISLASDGDDGPSGAAGAVVTGETMARAGALGLDPRDYLKNNDSLAFFEKVGRLIKTGATGTNVNDFVFLFGNLRT